ncbi:hypothetical protein TESG_02773 [Trichophyton tonsurans CBS 112818]|uniref:Uncharacterized protein n=2 Tax=Trichophyton TaxID=5550 RepID=F2PNB3_TRIEC|nr:hypothetical protein TESG_02773 [Trichophyton tonsurans CBS 112818]EGE03381.1 hypothetical protein TEQG_02416 [Trichophyton equinum CBS 127.97]
MAFVNMLGIIAGSLGIISFGLDKFSGESSHSGSTIKVAVALDGPQLSNSAGDLPDVRVWNEVGKFVGITVDPGRVEAGNIGEIKVQHDNQGVYTLFSANDDAVCIAWVSTTWTDDRGGNKYAVTGDFSEPCGGAWFPSNLYISDKKDHQPNCFWIDKNGDQPKTGFQVRWPAYSEDQFEKNSKDPKRLCNNIDFGLREEPDPNSINYIPKKKRDEHARARRSTIRRPGWASSELVISDSKHHSAKRLCMSDTSMGPDFAHTEEGLFCDMDAKVLYAFCADIEEKSACFDLKRQKIVTHEEETRVNATSTNHGPARYSRIRDWRTNSTVA